MQSQLLRQSETERSKRVGSTCLRPAGVKLHAGKSLTAFAPAQSITCNSLGVNPPGIARTFSDSHQPIKPGGFIGEVKKRAPARAACLALCSFIIVAAPIKHDGGKASASSAKTSRLPEESKATSRAQQPCICANSIPRWYNRSGWPPLRTPTTLLCFRQARVSAIPWFVNGGETFFLTLLEISSPSNLVSGDLCGNCERFRLSKHFLISTTVLRLFV